MDLFYYYYYYFFFGGGNFVRSSEAETQRREHLASVVTVALVSVEVRSTFTEMRASHEREVENLRHTMQADHDRILNGLRREWQAKIDELSSRHHNEAITLNDQLEQTRSLARDLEVRYQGLLKEHERVNSEH